MTEKQNITPNEVNKDSVPEDLQKENTIENNENQINKMEVHHHPNLEHKRKRLKEYFLEFLMIFLAVTLGFFAEQIREKKAEESKAKEFAKLLINDIDTDIKNFQAQAEYNKRKEDKLDTLVQLLSHPLLPSQYNDVYYYSAFLTKFIPSVQFNATYEQLKNSGSLRFFKNNELESQISHYYLYSLILSQGFLGPVNENQLKMEANKVISAVLRNIYIGETKIDNNYNFTYNIKRPSSRTTLLSTDPYLINQLSAFARMQKEESEFVRVVTLNVVQKTAVELKKNLIKEYNLE